jgi:hypothetical protein
MPAACGRMSRSQAGGLTMHCVILLAALSYLAIVTPGSAQSQDSRPRPHGDEITIPSQKTLERDAVRLPRNDFSTNDATATRQMERQNRRIDREVEKGICAGC